MTRLAHTPYLDAWRERLRAATAGRGVKAELARHMAGPNGNVRAWQIRIAKMLSAEMVPNGEDVLAITAWLDGRK